MKTFLVEIREDALREIVMKHYRFYWDNFFELVTSTPVKARDKAMAIQVFLEEDRLHGGVIRKAAQLLGKPPEKILQVIELDGIEEV